MSFLPSPARVVDEIEKLPNAVLERFYAQGNLKGIMRFGRYCKVPREVLDLVQIELSERNEEGIYIFESFAEKRRLKPVGIRDQNIDPLCV